MNPIYLCITVKNILMRILTVLFALACAAFAQTSFTVDQVMRAPFANSPVAAPKAARVAWLLNEQGARNVWVAEAPAWKARKLTSFDKDDGQEISDLAWAFDGSYLLFARGGWWRRIGRLTVATVVLAVASLSWIAAVELTPPDHRQ